MTRLYEIANDTRHLAEDVGLAELVTLAAGRTAIFSGALVGISKRCIVAHVDSCLLLCGWSSSVVLSQPTNLLDMLEVVVHDSAVDLVDQRAPVGVVPALRLVRLLQFLA
jgi:hypothetical protein